jgi:hypothetical protein
MAFSKPFDKLPPEIIIGILGALESPEALQSIIRTDSHIFRVFLQNRNLLLRPLRQSLYHQFPDQNLTQASLACRLRHIESGVPPQTRLQAREVIRPLLSQLPKPLPVVQLNLGTISKLYQLFREAEIFITRFSTESWRMIQDVISRRAHDGLDSRLPMSLPLSKTEYQEIQKSYLLFDACRHTLNFTTSLLQDYYLPESSSFYFYIPYKFIYQDKLLCVRTFQTVFRYVFKEYEHLLNQTHDRIAGPTHLYRPGTKNTTWLLQRQQFLNRSSSNHLQFTAYLCSQGYSLLLESQDMDSITLEERILSLYMRFSQFRENGLTYPLVTVADLEFSLKQLCYGADSDRQFWASGVFIWDEDRLQQLEGYDLWLLRALIEGSFQYLTGNSSSEDGSEDDSD